MYNYADTVLSQYYASPTITGMIAAMNDAIDPATNLDNFYNQMWNVDTAIGWGLDVIGRKVGVVRVLQVATDGYFGMSGPDGMSGDSFDTLPMYSGSDPLTANYELSDDAFRVLILAKAAANICDGSIPGINRVLQLLFGQEGAAYCTDGRDMTMTYTFAFQLSPVDYAIVFQSGALPRPTGVSVTIVQGS